MPDVHWLLDRDRSAVVVVDVQEKMKPHLLDPDRLVRRCRLLVDAAKELGVPVLTTEQYPQGLGHTVADLAPADGDRFEKSDFTAARVVADRLAQEGRTQVVLCGCETHVCVLQTALHLRQDGVQVAVCADAVSSRSSTDMSWGLHRMTAAGVVVTTVEAVVFEWTEGSQAPQFKAISALVKEAGRADD